MRSSDNWGARKRKGSGRRRGEDKGVVAGTGGRCIRSAVVYCLPVDVTRRPNAQNRAIRHGHRCITGNLTDV